MEPFPIRRRNEEISIVVGCGTGADGRRVYGRRVVAERQEWISIPSARGEEIRKSNWARPLGARDGDGRYAIPGNRHHGYRSRWANGLQSEARLSGTQP